MGQRGPLAQSNVIRIDRGNPGGRLTPTTLSDKAKREAPKPPSWLDRDAKAEWGRVVGELDDLGILAKVDRAVLAIYCDAWSQFNKARNQLRKHGQLVTGHRGALTKNPAWQLYRESAALVAQLAKEIGCSPNARLRMTLPDVDGESDGEGILD